MTMPDTQPVWSMICSTCDEMRTVSKAGLGKERQREAERLAVQHLARNHQHIVHVGYSLDSLMIFGESSVEARRIAKDLSPYGIMDPKD